MKILVLGSANFVLKDAPHVLVTQPLIVKHVISSQTQL
jgi:hypothetical protein